MDIRYVSCSPATIKVDAVAVALFQDNGLTEEARTLDQGLKGCLSAALDAREISGKTGECLVLRDCHHAPARRIVLVGLGKSSDYRGAEGLRAFEKAMQSLGKTLLALQCPAAAVFAPAPDGCGIQAHARILTAALNRAAYRYAALKSTPAEPAFKLKQITVALPAATDANLAARGVSEGQALASGEALARDLGNTPPNICTPRYLAEAARKLAKDKRVQVEVLERKQLEALNMGALLAVAQGSDEPPRFIVIRYNGAPTKNAKQAAGGKARKGEASYAPLVLVGKGITFDSGGISLKPGLGMDEMKFDMCGAASVLGVMQAVSRLGLALNVIGVVVASENMPSGRACKPGDVVTSSSGQTIEILNTDAEGRLVLCDALTYVKRFQPAAVIDIATLTGACVTALGHVNSGLFSPDDALADALLQASRDGCDPTWRMPLTADYQEQLHSNFADIANIGGPPAGAVTAACFLSRFTQDYRWAHLDIAGVAWKGGAREKGATGRPVSLLLHFLLNSAAGEGVRAAAVEVPAQAAATPAAKSTRAAKSLKKPVQAAKRSARA